MVKVLHFSGCFSACRGAHVPVYAEDHGNHLALPPALLGCQGFCGIVPNGPASSYSGSSVYGRTWNGVPLSGELQWVESMFLES